MSQEEKLLEKIEREGKALSIIKEGEEIFSSRKSGLLPLIELRESEIDTENSLAVDRVVGGAAAYIFCLLDVNKVVTNVASRSAVRALEEKEIDLYAREKVKNIVNPDTGEVCKFEKLSKEYEDFEKFYEKVKETIM